MKVGRHNINNFMQTIEMEQIPEKEESLEAKDEEKPLDQPDGPIEVEKVV